MTLFSESSITEDKVLVIDFGSQVTHLICRRIRELGAYSELISCLHATPEHFLTFKPKAVILSGGPNSVYEKGSPHLHTQLWSLFYKYRVPVLGICYGLQEMVWALGGKVEAGGKREFGYAELEKIETDQSGLFSGIENKSQIWMSHGDKVTAMAPGFEICGYTGNSEFAAIANLERNFYGVQFHPEVSHSKKGKEIFQNFLTFSFSNKLAYTDYKTSTSPTTGGILASPQTVASTPQESPEDTNEGGSLLSEGGGKKRFRYDDDREEIEKRFASGFSFKNWSMKNFCEIEIANIRNQVGSDEFVLGGISGGVDSSVAAALMQKAIGDRFHPFLIDTGLLRKNERVEVEKRLCSHIDGLKLKCVDASEEFYVALKGETEPEKKRKIVGKLFIDAFEKAIKQSKLPIEKTYLLQGTLYPDVIESTSFKGPSSVIKSHHNVGGLPERLKFKGLIEPLRMLFKDEVRSLGRELGLANESVMRHPFPGPGLAIRIVGGEITKERADILREADGIFLDELKSTINPETGKAIYHDIGQAFAILIPECKTVGVMGDARTYEMTCALRAVQSQDFMTADFYPIDWKLLAKISSRIINEVRGVNRVVYDCSSKPPATIEWE